MPVANYTWDVDNDAYLFESDSTGAISAMYTATPDKWGGLTSQQRSGAVTYHVFDGFGSTRQLVNDAAEVIATYRYDGFGNHLLDTSDVDNPFTYRGFRGMYWDDEITQYYLRAREYSPSLARFTSADPIAMEVLMRGISESSYIYADNTPTRFADPGGLKKCEDVTSWSTKDCKCTPSPCTCVKSKDGAKEVTDQQLTALQSEFEAKWNKRKGFEINGFSVVLVMNQRCVPDKPLAAITCPVLDAKGTPTKVYVCIPKVSYCDARALMAHEMTHVAWNANDKYNSFLNGKGETLLTAGDGRPLTEEDKERARRAVRVNAEKEAYEEQCKEMRSQECKGTAGRDFGPCTKTLINFSIGGKAEEDMTDAEKALSPAEKMNLKAEKVKGYCQTLVSDAQGRGL